MGTYKVPELDPYPVVVVKILDPNLAKMSGSDQERISNTATMCM
jgi:hypothetical protein